MKKTSFGINSKSYTTILLSAGLSTPAFAVNINVAGGWVCNMWMQQTGALGATANFADFNVKSTPSSATQSYSFISGESADYLSRVGGNFNALTANLPFMEPLSFNFPSETFGARFGVDVCIPATDVARDDVLDWTVTLSSVGPLIPPAEGDWFSVATPRVGMNILASNCNKAAGAPMSTASPLLSGKCDIVSTPSAGADVFTFSGQSIVYKFIKMASREMVLRFSVTEQSVQKRPHRLDSGIINFDLVDPPLPPLLVGDLLGKQLFYAPDRDLSVWPGCANFQDSFGLAFAEMNLQGPNGSLDLKWTGKDNDCTQNGTCPNGNIGGNNFSFPVSVFLEDGTPAGPGTPATSRVRNFFAVFDDLQFSGENVLPANGKIEFDTNIDQVYRDSGKAFFSTTVSRLTSVPAQTNPPWRTCRVWFKRDNGFKCSTLPDARLRSICAAM